MTDAFKNVVKNESSLFKAIMEVMSLDVDEEGLLSLATYRPFLSLVDNYISYYQNRNGSMPEVPIFYMLGANDMMRELLSKYLTIRLGIFNEKTMSNLRKELAFILNSATL